MFKTIKSKFIVLSLIVIILSIGIPVGVLVTQVSQNFHDRSVLMIEATLDLMIDGLNNSMMRGDQKNVQNIVEQISSKRGIDHIRVFDKSGNIKFSNEKYEVGQIINIIEPGHIETEIPKIVQREITINKNTKTYKAVQPIFIEKRCQTCHKDNSIISYLDVDTDFTQAEITYYTGSLHLWFLGIALIIILAYGFYVLFNQFINKPLNECMLALDSIEAGNMDIKLSVKGNDEFSKLHSHFNQMVKELKYSREKIDELHFEQLQRADRMVTIGELTAAMSHDINNHSAIIMSRADYLLYKTENKSFPLECKGDLEVINDQIEKISKITGNILKHSKKLSKSFSKIDLTKLVKNTINMLKPLMDKQNIILKENYLSENAVINGDTNQIEQVIINLLSNAIDILEKEGILTVSVKISSDSNLMLIVEDNGIGIDEESIKMIFSPFYTNKPSGKGTGLGLYIVENICKNHGAKITCESKVNEGTKFTITF